MELDYSNVGLKYFNLYMSKQQIQPPFQNKYKLRLVSQSDSKSCLICYKPTNVVLITENNADFFFICNSHLLDESFAKPIESKEYNDLKNEVDNLEKQLTEVNKKIEETKPYLWGINYWSKDKKKNDKDDKEKENKENKESKEDKSKANSHESYKSKATEIEKNLSTKKEELQNHKFKHYNLNSTTYKNRLMLNQKKKYNKERSEKIQTDGFFPSAPTHNIN
ncbi:hypothetical protein KGF54_000066 [Candida jiufengensis]|uniref:uncharacterized protein n=1 Tax=Candida jiufengensis TaxID=497108 RepID=UPI002225908D|nr:uncharacterized protein KGF54_000066 [Candida jiufengensis]KAI5957138.1 hypothetical protein KGF54_000066 [Candida jiufengensis]